MDTQSFIKTVDIQSFIKVFDTIWLCTAEDRFFLIGCSGQKPNADGIIEIGPSEKCNLSESEQKGRLGLALMLYGQDCLPGITAMILISPNVDLDGVGVSPHTRRTVTHITSLWDVIDVECNDVSETLLNRIKTVPDWCGV